MVDLHCHFPMRLLPEVEAPRDVVRQMFRVRAREAGRIRAAVLLLAARLVNFRYLGATWGVDPELGGGGGGRGARPRGGGGAGAPGWGVRCPPGRPPRWP